MNGLRSSRSQIEARQPFPAHSRASLKRPPSLTGASSCAARAALRRYRLIWSTQGPAHRLGAPRAGGVPPADGASAAEPSPAPPVPPAEQQQQQPQVAAAATTAAGPQPAAAAAAPGSWPRRLLRRAARRLAAPPERLRLYWPIAQRFLVTVSMLAVIRLGYFVAVPGLDMASLPAEGMGASEGERMMRALYGQAQQLPASIFDLGISPHINASILVAVLLMLPKELLSYSWADRLREARKEGKAGEAFINERTNWLAFGIALHLSLMRALELAPYALASQGFVPQTMLTLIAGSFMIHHCAGTITAHGVGNGSTLVICMGIITEYADTIHSVLTGLEAASLALWKLGLIAAGYLSLLLFTVFLSSSEVRLPILQYSTTAPQEASSNGGAGGGGGRAELFAAARSLLDRKATAKGRQAAYFPLLLNSSGVMPMIIASAAFYGFLPKALAFLGLQSAAAGLAALQASMWGLVVYGLLVFCMEFLPFGAVNPPEVSEYFSAINVGIKGVAPGHETTEHLRAQLRACKFWGGLALGSLAVAAQLFDQLCLEVIGTTLATTSLIIIVGFVLQTARQVESLREGPSLQSKLDGERQVIQSLAGM